METISFMTSLLTFYLKGEIKQEQNFIRFKVPNTILTFIPLGSAKETVPVNQISSVGTSFKLLFKSFLVGVILAFIGLLLLTGSPIIGIILLLLGASMAINSFQTVLTVDTTSGKELYIFFLIFEKSKAERAAQQINQLISNRLDDTNNRRQTDRMIEHGDIMTDKIVNAINQK